MWRPEEVDARLGTPDFRMVHRDLIHLKPLLRACIAAGVALAMTVLQIDLNDQLVDVLCVAWMLHLVQLVQNGARFGQLCGVVVAEARFLEQKTEAVANLVFPRII